MAEGRGAWSSDRRLRSIVSRMRIIRHGRAAVRLSAPLLVASWLLAQQPESAPFVPSAEQMQALSQKAAELNRRLQRLTGKVDAGLLADVWVFHKAAEWALRHPEEFFSKAYYENALKVLDVGRTRAAELERGSASWAKRTGRLVRAYRSRVDGSIQPYAVWAPPGYDGSTALRVDVILHGRNARLTEVSFIAEHEWGKPSALPLDRIELHVFGRTNNAYRWAGETDVFEALESLKERYRVDPARILLRGFSMGGAGAWHLGLHYPDRWAGIEAGAGFSETRRYARLDQAPEHEQRVWPIYDAYLWARNLVHLPAVGYGSADDPQLEASRNVKEQLEREAVDASDLRVLFLVGPRIGHKFAPESKQESELFLTQAMEQPRPVDRIRFLTYTTRYGRCHWLAIDGLERHYQRGEVDARLESGMVRIATRGVTRLLVHRNEPVEIDGERLAAAPAFEKIAGRWRPAALIPPALRKRAGLQGPIDDAFMDSFLCVRPTGKPRDLQAHQRGLERLEQFRRTWDKFLRGDIRIKDDRDVTPEDIRNSHLILFGDPGSNRWIARLLAREQANRLPVEWSSDAVQVAGTTVTARHALLVAIYPNPLNPNRYVVLNSGHTFEEKDFRGTNALLYPRLGDWAVLGEQGVVRVGFFDENWR